MATKILGSPHRHPVSVDQPQQGLSTPLWLCNSPISTGANSPAAA
jgi:hypothetical protein